MDRSPLMFLTREHIGEATHLLFDPITRSLTSIQIPELCLPVECLSSAHGWLLLLSRETSSLFFFNPFTRQRIELPYHQTYLDAATFSAPPTSSDCMVFIVKKRYNHIQVKINTLRVGEKTWSNCTFNTKNFETIVQAVYCAGVLYCMDSLGRIGAFKAGERTWRVLYTLKCPMIRHSYLMESRGEILAGVKDSSGVLTGLFKLELGGEVRWVEVKDLKDVLLFLGPYGSCSSATMQGLEVVVASYRPDSKCVVYNWDGSCYSEGIMGECSQIGWQYTPIWIQPSN